MPALDDVFDPSYLSWSVVAYDYSSVPNCEWVEEDGEFVSSCGDICRCSTIEDALVTSVDFGALTSRVVSAVEGHLSASSLPPLTLLDRYALLRLLTAHRLWEPSSYEVLVESGYYGEEVGGVALEGAGPLLDTLLVFAASDSHDRVRLSLEAEYGRVLPSLARASFRVVEVDLSRLLRPQAHHVERTRSGHAAFDPSLPVALVHGAASAGPLRVVDGYHRTASAVLSGLERVLVVLVVP